MVVVVVVGGGGNVPHPGPACGGVCGGCVWVCGVRKEGRARKWPMQAGRHKKRQGRQKVHIVKAGQNRHMVAGE